MTTPIDDDFEIDEITPAFAERMGELHDHFSHGDYLSADAWPFIQTKIPDHG